MSTLDTFEKVDREMDCDTCVPSVAQETTKVADGESTDADLIVIGGGSAGFAAAIAAHEFGARVIMVNGGLIGGTCVNVGCVPSKTLIRAAEACHQGNNPRFDGIQSKSRLTDFSTIRAGKDELVSSLRQSKYIDVLASYENVRLVEGRAKFVSADTIETEGVRLRAAKIVVATGSHPWIPPIPGLREIDPLTSTTAFELNRLPDSIIVLGGRYIGIETAQMLSRFGVKVTILQRSSHLLPPEDRDISDALAEYLRDEGITIKTDVTVGSVERSQSGVTVHARTGARPDLITAAEILCATGRRANIDGLGLEQVGISINPDGTLKVDTQLQTTIAGVYAAGDVVGEPEFVYTAAYEGRLAVENAFAGPRKGRDRDYSVLPWVIFSDPQIAGVGHNQRSAAQAGIDFDVATLSLAHVPRALAARNSKGFVKLIRERGTQRLIGARILAPEGGEQIMEAALAMRYRIPVSDLASMFHPYLTQSEAIKLCAQAFEKDVSKMSCCA